MKIISKYGIYLRLVEESDAEFILSLRTNPKLNAHISYTSPHISEQVKWIKEYKIKEFHGLEYYYIAHDQYGNKYGTIRLYNFDERSFELGSWVFMPNSPLGIAAKTHLIGLETGFEQLNAEYCRIAVRKNNVAVVRYIMGFKAIIVHEDDIDYYFNLSKESFYMHKPTMPFFLSGNTKKELSNSEKIDYKPI